MKTLLIIFHFKPCTVLTLLFIWSSESSVSQSLSEITNIADSNWIEFREDLHINPTSVFQIHNAAFGLGEDDEMVIQKTKEDAYGFSHYRYQQKYKGVKVEGGVYSIHASNGIALTGSGRIIKNISLDIMPTVTSNAVINNAMEEVKIIEAGKYNAQLDTLVLEFDSAYPIVPELTISKLSTENWNSENIKLLYRMKVKIFEPSNFTYYVYADAKTGNILETISGMFYNIGTVTTLYNGTQSFESKWTGSLTQYKLIDETRGNNIETKRKRTGTNQFLNDSDNDWDDNQKKQNHASTHWAAQQVWDCFANPPFNRNGPDDNGIGLDIVTNILGSESCGGISNSSDPDSDPLELNFVAELTGWTNARVSLDDVGHEFTHGVGYIEAGWVSSQTFIPSDEAYAIMEGTCDIFGELAEFYVQGNVDWEFDGDAITNNSCLRVFSPPVLDGESALEYGDNNWNNFSDGHSRGGVLRYWFFLISDGGIGTNHLGNPFCVEGIGILNAGQILYETLNNGFFSTASTFLTARNATIQVAQNIFGTNSNEVAQVTQAWYAVAVGPIFSGTIEYDNLSITGNESIAHNTEITFNSLQVAASGNMTVTSDTKIVMHTTSKASSGAFFHAFITPACVGSAKQGDDDNNDDYITETKSEEKLMDEPKENNINETYSISIHPNPTSGEFQLTIDSKQSAEIYIYDIFGRLIYNQHIHSSTNQHIDISQHPKGIYLIKVIQGEKVYIQKLIHQ